MANARCCRLWAGGCIDDLAALKSRHIHEEIFVGEVVEIHLLHSSVWIEPNDTAELCCVFATPPPATMPSELTTAYPRVHFVWELNDSSLSVFYNGALIYECA